MLVDINLNNQCKFNFTFIAESYFEIYFQFKYIYNNNNNTNNNGNNNDTQIILNYDNIAELRQNDLRGKNVGMFFTFNNQCQLLNVTMFENLNILKNNNNNLCYNGQTNTYLNNNGSNGYFMALNMHPVVCIW